MSRLLLLVAVVALTGCPPPPTEGPPTPPVIPVVIPVVWDAMQAPTIWVDSLSRTRVPGGWLVVVTDSGRPATCFVPDADGAWLRPEPEAPR